MMARSMIVSYILYPGSQDVPVRVRAVRNPKALGRDDNAICQGRRVSADTVGDLLRAEGFSLQGNAKTLEGQRYPDRDAQFRYINEQVKAHQGTADPVISVDTKKKELVGQFANAGREWRPGGRPVQVNSHDFPRDSAGRAVPYGTCDITGNAGWVSAGTDHDTAAFAVESVRRWWNAAGRDEYPAARRLLVTADAGGSGGYRTRAWKAELAALAVETGLEITVCHFPPGTSKWNKVGHRVFSHVTMNWRGRPLSSHEVIVQTIAATTTRTGLRVRGELDDSPYETGVKISDRQMDALPLTRHDWHGDWNYTLRPEAYDHDAGALEPFDQPSPDLAWLCRPALTGLPAAEWDALTAALMTLHDQQREASLDQAGHTIQPGPHRLASLDDLYKLAISTGIVMWPEIKTACHAFVVGGDGSAGDLGDLLAGGGLAGWVLVPAAEW
jgi:Rhodopirellula transposase DDE domain